MSKYTTGEMAKLCGVTVRTVQYYDARGILIPSELSEGGRRLYSEDDLKRLKVICFLRELDIPIDAISKILKEEHPLAGAELAFSVSFSMILLNSTMCKTLSFMEIVILPDYLMIGISQVCPWG